MVELSRMPAENRLIRWKSYNEPREKPKQMNGMAKRESMRVRNIALHLTIEFVVAVSNILCADIEYELFGMNMWEIERWGRIIQSLTHNKTTIRTI